jgi:hypothetical protein
MVSVAAAVRAGTSGLLIAVVATAATSASRAHAALLEVDSHVELQAFRALEAFELNMFVRISVCLDT